MRYLFRPWEASGTPAVTVEDAGDEGEDECGLVVQESGGDGSLAWDEFQPVSSKECSPWKKHIIPSATVSMEDLLCTASFPANTSTVADGLDKLLSAIPPAQLAFNASPIQEVFELMTGTVR